MSAETGLVSVGDTETLLAALDGTGLRLTAESNALYQRPRSLTLEGGFPRSRRV
jgi:hypothetical protein